MAAILTRNLTKKYHDLVAVNNVNLELREHECFGLLGPNGAGKTTLIRMITATTPPTSGYIEVLGKDLATHAREIKACLGVVPQEDNLDEDLPVFQNLTTFARYFSIPRQEAHHRALEVLTLFRLEEKRNSPIRQLSGGMRRRLLIARGLINRPKMVILDEPTVGLDPPGRHLVWQKLRQLKDQGISQLLCTQSMDEATQLCDRVAIMYEGKIVTEDTPDALVARYAGEEVLEIPTPVGLRDGLARELTGLKLDFVDMGDRIRIFHSTDDEIAAILTKYSVKVRRDSANLEDVFFRLTGRELE